MADGETEFDETDLEEDVFETTKGDGDEIGLDVELEDDDDEPSPGRGPL